MRAPAFQLTPARVLPLAVIVLAATTRQGPAQPAEEKASAPTNLRCEYRVNPLGMDVLAPRLSWQLQDARRGARQSAYQVIVSTDEAFARPDALAWDSGRIDSDQSVHVVYAGKPLASGTRYFWKVRTWDGGGIATEYSLPAWFETGLLTPADWKARWITAPLPPAPASQPASQPAEKKGPRRSICMRHEFTARARPARARAYVTGLGTYKLYINGKPVGDQILSPGWTDYRYRVQYQTYDVTELLNAGPNAIGAILGNGWWSGGLGWQGAEAYSQGNLRLCLQLAIDYADGTGDVISTSEQGWRSHASPILRDTLYHGETYDARLEMDGWAVPGFDASKWVPAIPVPSAETKAALVADRCEPIRVTQTLKPAWLSEPTKGVYIFDFGQNASGFVRLKVRGGAGTQIRLRFGEELDRNGRLYRENYRTAEATDYYICKGTGEETWEPLFTYRGMRYCEVTGYPGGRPADEALQFRVFHTDVQPAGVFACSHPLLTQLFKNIVWGQRSNIHSVPTDCPQRDERLGWTGDANVFGRTSCWNMDMAAFYHKWMRDVMDSQSPEGWVTDVAPAMVMSGPAAPGWGDACVVTPWTVWQHYGDTRIIEETFDSMVKWIEYMHAQRDARSGLYERKGYGDWVATVESPTNTIGAAYYYYSTKLVAEMARAIGRSTEADTYARRADEIAAGFNRQWFNAETGNYPGQTQTANLLPLHFGIVPPEQRAAVMVNIVENIRQRDYHLSTGFLGTAYLMTTLAEHGHQETAYKLATQTTCPSWLYMLLNGATTMWERWDTDKWDPNMNSRNHYAFGAVGRWMVEDLAGINIDPAAPGFKHILIRPRPAGDLAWASATYASLYGDVKSEWHRTRDGLTLDITIPANTTARVFVPTLNRKRVVVFEGTKPVYASEDEDPGKPKPSPDSPAYAHTERGFVVFDVAAGRYAFTLTAE